jgi:hypothetical protein
MSPDNGTGGVTVVSSDKGVFRRRAVLAGGAGLLGAGLISRAALAADPVPVAPGPGDRAQIVQHPAVKAGYQFLNLAMDAYPHYGTVRLLQSYADEAGLYSTAYVTDSALAVLAYLAEGSDASVERARQLGEALKFAQDRDPGYRDGRLRRSYTVGPYLRNGVEQTNGFIEPEGTVDIGNALDHSGSFAGDQAWAGLALLALVRRGLNPAFLTTAVNLGNWVQSTCGADQPLGGYRAGVSSTGETLTRTDTAHNAVLAAFFGQLAAATGDAVWTARQAGAANFVRKMWQPSGGFYASGSDDGQVPDQFPVTTEAQTAAVLALNGTANGTALDWIATQLTVTDNALRANSALPADYTVTGPTSSDRSRLVDPGRPIEPGLARPDPDAVWFTGAAQLAAALMARGKPGDLEAAHDWLNTLAEAQQRLGGGQRIANKALPPASGIVAASSPLHGGVTDGGYYPARHSGTTAWFLLAVTGLNPLAIDGVPQAPNPAPPVPANPA